MELYSGEMLFPTHENYEHLAMIERIIGFIPQSMARNCDRSIRKFFDDRYEFNWPKLASSSRSERSVREVSTLEVSYRQELIPSKYRSFRELIYDCLEINPNRRIRSREALRHKFFRED